MDSETNSPSGKESFLHPYEELKNCLMEIAGGLNKNDIDISQTLHLLEKSYGLAQDITTHEETPLYQEAMVQARNQLGWQHRALTELMSKQKASSSVSELDHDSPPEFTDDMTDTNKLIRQRVIESTRQIPRAEGLKSVAGLSEAKEVLHEVVYLPMKFPHLFTGGLQPSNKILLYGPPGTGKTQLVNAFAAEMNVPLYSVTSTDLLSTWLGESEKLIRELFEYTREQAEHCIIFIDEVDSICRQRTSQETEVTRRMKNELLAQMNSCDGFVFLMCATNCPWDIDSAFLRRFQRRIYIPLPSRNERCEILKLQLRDARYTLSDSDWSRLLDLTDHFSGSDLNNLITSALLKPLRELTTATHWLVNKDNQLMPCDSSSPEAIQCHVQSLPHGQVVSRPMSLVDLLSALHDCRRSVGADDVAKFESFASKFG